MMRMAVPDLVSNSYFPAVAAVELGFFKAEGLDITNELLFPVPKTMEALREGELDFVAGSAHATLTANSSVRCRAATSLRSSPARRPIEATIGYPTLVTQIDRASTGSSQTLRRMVRDFRGFLGFLLDLPAQGVHGLIDSFIAQTSRPFVVDPHRIVDEVLGIGVGQ